MAETNVLGPLSNLTPSTGWGQPQRVHRDQTGSSAAFSVWAGRRTTWYNCFDSNQIPAGATIDGVEFVLTGSTGSNGFGTAGSTGPSESATINVRAWNGTSYSSIIYTNTFTGANDYDGPTIGGPTDLHGLTWNAADQADFGFDIDCASVVATPVAVVIRGVAMKVYYTASGGGGGISGILEIHRTATSDLSSFNDTPVGNIASVHGI